jgi:hypothetical protein
MRLILTAPFVLFSMLSPIGGAAEEISQDVVPVINLFDAQPDGTVEAESVTAPDKPIRPWSQIGYGRLVNNDFYCDTQDRGQTGSYVSSRMMAKSWLTEIPSRAFELFEVRIQGDIKAPDNLRRPAPFDRPYAGSLSAGLHTHFKRGATEFAVGAEIVGTGPFTRLDEFQMALHDLLRVPAPSRRVLDAQVGNRVTPGAVVEVNRPYALSERTLLRPFAEARGGVENMVRVGVDLSFGELANGSMMVRDGITGQRYRTVLGDGRGYAFVLGVDAAKVQSSLYLPANRGLVLTDRRDRARMGMMWQKDRSHGFFGVTYLGEEFTTKGGSQVVGSLRLAINF